METRPAELTLADWTERLTLKRVGSEFVGACPICGGRDRFHVRSGFQGKALVGCRGCIDGNPPDVRRSAYLSIVEAVFGERPRPVPRTRVRIRHRQMKREQRRLWKSTARKAAQMIHRAHLDTHPYLEAKGFPEARGFVDRKGFLLIPIRSRRGKVMSIQTIDGEGRKKFIYGGRTGGGRLQLGRERERWVCEGYATALSIAAALERMVIRASVVVAFSAGNITKVARDGDRVIVDHDKTGTGEQVARDLGLPWWMPPKPGDANDLHQEEGLEALIGGLRTVL